MYFHNILNCITFLQAGSSWSPDMDEQTRQARFESMRRAPGMRRVSSNKKLFVVHKDLQKQCVRLIRRHEFDRRINTAEVRRQQNVMERKRDKLANQQKRFEIKNEKTHAFLENVRKSHAKCDEVIRQSEVIDTDKVKPQYVDIIRAIGTLSMPRSMKERLRWECTVNPIRD